VSQCLRLISLCQLNHHEKFIILERSRPVFLDIRFIDGCNHYNGLPTAPISVGLDRTLLGDSRHYSYSLVISLFLEEAQDNPHWKPQILAQFTWFSHAGVHFNAILPWLVVIAMLVNVISGLTGKFLLNRAQRYLSSKKDDLLQQGMSTKGIEKEIFWDAVTLDLMKKWRAVHFPITLVFSVLSLIHIISIFLFWEWK